MTDTPRILVAQLEARTDRLEKGLAKANATLQKQWATIEGRTAASRKKIEAETAAMADAANRNLARIGKNGIDLKGIETAVAGVKGALAGIMAGAFSGLSIAGVRENIAALAKIDDAAQRTGASAKFIQELQFAVRQSGGEAEDASRGLERFAVNASKAAQGSGDLAKLFEANGVALRDQSGGLRSTEELLNELADLIKGASSEQDRLNIASAAFGRQAGPAMVVALSQGRDGLRRFAAEANKLGAVIDGKVIDKAAALDDEFEKLNDRIGGISKTIAVEFAGPVVMEALEEFAKALQQIKDIIDGIRAADLGKVFEGWKIEGGVLGYLLGKPSAQGSGLDELERQAQELRGKIAEAQKLPENTPGKALVENYKRELDAIESRIEELKRRAADFVPSRAGYTAGGLETPGKATVMPSEGGGAADQSDVFKLIAKFEAFRANAYWDKTAWRAGYGSDTTTRANGSVERVTKETVVSEADAIRDLNRRIGEFQAGIIGKIGMDRWNALGEQQKAALTSTAYNYGSLPDRVAGPITSGATTEQIANAIRRLGTDNAGINADRREREGDLFQNNATFAAQTRDKAATFDADNVRDSGRRVEDLNAEAAALDRQAQASGTARTALEQFDAEAEHQKIILREMRALKDADIEATPSRIAAINAQADAEVAAAQKKVQAEQRVQQAKKVTAQTVQAADQLSDIGKDAFKSFGQDLLAGVSAGEAFRNVLNRIASKLLDMALDQIWMSAFGNSASTGGGLFGGIAKLFGFAGGGYTGDGGVNEPAGVVHRGEVVWSQDDVARAGGVATVEAMRRGRRGYAKGGAVASLPAVLPKLVVPSMTSASEAIGAGIQNIQINTPITVNGGGGSPEQNQDMARRVAKEAEGTIRGIVVKEIMNQRRGGNMLNSGR